MGPQTYSHRQLSGSAGGSEVRLVSKHIWKKKFDGPAYWDFVNILFVLIITTDQYGDADHVNDS